MNFLAHLYLAGSSDASRIGNLLGDFVKGTPESLVAHYPPEVIAGIVMHRHLDRFTDQNEHFLTARDLLVPERRRFAGIVVDIFFDHFLTIHWDQFAETPLTEFVAEMYATLERHPDWLSPEFATILPRMHEENWLSSYGTTEGIALTLERVSRRSPRIAPIKECSKELDQHYEAFESAFHLFFPAARIFAATLF